MPARVSSAAVSQALAAQPGIINCNPDFNVAQIGVITRWTPVKNLTFSVDTVYTRLDQKFEGVFTFLPPSLLWPSRQLRTS